MRFTYYSGLYEEAEEAMLATPAYFARWYTYKSIGLGVLAAFTAYLLAKMKYEKR